MNKKTINSTDWYKVFGNRLTESDTKYLNDDLIEIINNYLNDIIVKKNLIGSIFSQAKLVANSLEAVKRMKQ